MNMTCKLRAKRLRIALVYHKIPRDYNWARSTNYRRTAQEGYFDWPQVFELEATLFRLGAAQGSYEEQYECQTAQNA